MKRAKAQPPSVKPPVAVELRKLAKDLKDLTGASMVISSAWPFVGACADRLCAEARVIEANAQLDKARTALEKIRDSKKLEGYHTRQAQALQRIAEEGLT